MAAEETKNITASSDTSSDVATLSIYNPTWLFSTTKGSHTVVEDLKGYTYTCAISATLIACLKEAKLHLIDLAAEERVTKVDLPTFKRHPETRAFWEPAHSIYRLNATTIVIDQEGSVEAYLYDLTTKKWTGVYKHFGGAICYGVAGKRLLFINCISSMYTVNLETAAVANYRRKSGHWCVGLPISAELPAGGIFVYDKRTCSECQILDLATGVWTDYVYKDPAHRERILAVIPVADKLLAVTVDDYVVLGPHGERSQTVALPML